VKAIRAGGPHSPGPSLPEGERGEKRLKGKFLLFPSSPSGRGGVGEVRDAGATTLELKAAAESETRIRGDFERSDR
jgi:hypothetical protein